MSISFSLPGGPVPTPFKFNTPTAPGLPGGQSPLPLAQSGGSPFSTAQLQSAFGSAGLSDIWSTIGNIAGTIGGDVMSVLGKILPHNAEGGIDWGAIGGDIKSLGSWLSAHKADIIDGLNAYNQYTRSQQSDKYAKAALAGAKETYDAKAPLRVAGQAGMLDPSAKAPDLTALKAQGQQGLTLSMAQVPTQDPGQAQGLANLRNLAGQNSGNTFGKTLPLASAAPTPPTPPTSGPPNIARPPLPIAAPPRRPEPFPGQGQIFAPTPPTSPSPPTTGATTTASTYAPPNKQGKYNPSGLTPNDANVGTPIPIGYGIQPLPLAG